MADMLGRLFFCGGLIYCSLKFFMVGYWVEGNYHGKKMVHH